MAKISRSAPDYCIFLKQLPLNTKQKFEFLYYLTDGEKILSVVVGVVSFSAAKSLDIHDAILSG